MQNVKAGFIERYTARTSGAQSKTTASSGKKSFEDIIFGNLNTGKTDASNSTSTVKTAGSKDTNASKQDVKGSDDVNSGQDKTPIKPDKQDNGIETKTDNAKAAENVVQSGNTPKTDSDDKNTSMNTKDTKLVDISNINIQELLNAIKNGIGQKLGISEEDLNKALESLGFTPLSLLDVNNLKQFLLKVSNNEDMSAFLTQDGLGNSLKELMNVCDTIKNQFSISKEQLSVLTQPAAAENKLIPDIQTEPTTNVNDIAKPEKEIDITVVKTVQTESKHSNEDNKTGSQKAEQNLNATELLIHNLAVNSGSEEALFTNQLSKAQQIREITSQILDSIRINIKPDQTSMELQLNPENLGKINLVVVSKEGVLTAKFVTGSETTKEAIESQLQTFKENLNNQGLKVENVEVTVSYSAFDQREQGFQNSTGGENQEKPRNRVFKGLDELNDTTLDSAKEDSVNLVGLEQSTSSVNYTA